MEETQENKIVCIIRPFVSFQHIFIYNEGEIINTSSKIDDLPETLHKICKQYNIQKIEIGGTIPYGEVIKKEFVSKYEDFPIQIETI